MCGIAGAIAVDARAIVEPMTEALVHRGPDEFGYYHGDRISMGQRRLSIIDLSGGKQPITNEDSTIHLVCNGEIYNSPELRNQLVSAGHSFRTETDVEVIIHLYEEHGRDCVKHLRGMFSFAIWDQQKQTLLLARDHLGQKPLYYYHENDVLLFGSEVKSILASDRVERSIDLNGLWHYVSLRFLPDQRSLFKGVCKLQAATTLVWQRGKISMEPYWDVSFVEKMAGNEDEIAERLDAFLRQTVTMHLLSDVRVGTFLSGGIDSGLVSAIMAEVSDSPIPSFSVGVREQSYNELPYARLVAEKYRMEAYERVVEADLVHNLPSMVYHLDEPADPFAVGVFLVSREAAKKVKVVLTGDGGDENFAGYDRFAGQRLAGLYNILPEWFRREVMRRLIDRLPASFTYKSFSEKARYMNQVSFYTGGRRYAESMAFLRYSNENRQHLFTELAQKQINDHDSVAKILTHFEAANAKDLVDRMLYTDLKTRMPDHLLLLVDRMTMAHSLESRAPLIDYRVVEFAAAIPANLKLNGVNLKYILRKVASRYLPRNVVHRPKQGFGFPIGAWMRNEMRNLLDGLVRESRFVQQGLFEPNYIRRLVHEHSTGKVEHTFRLWILINLELWHRIYMEHQSVDSVCDDIQRMAFDTRSAMS